MGRWFRTLNMRERETVSAQVPEDLKESITLLSREQGVSRSEVVRRACMEYIRRETGQRQPGVVTQLLEDLGRGYVLLASAAAIVWVFGFMQSLMLDLAAGFIGAAAFVSLVIYNTDPDAWLARQRDTVTNLWGRFTNVL